MYQPYLVAMSHLSDAQELISIGMFVEANTHINFAKWLIGRYKEDMVSEFNVNDEWDEYMKKS